MNQELLGGWLGLLLLFSLTALYEALRALEGDHD